MSHLFIEGVSGRWGSLKVGGEKVYDFTTNEIAVFKTGGVQPGTNMFGAEVSHYYGAGWKGSLVNESLAQAYQGASFTGGLSEGIPGDIASLDGGFFLSADGEFDPFRRSNIEEPTPRYDGVKGFTFGGSLGMAIAPPNNAYGSIANSTYLPSSSQQFSNDWDMISNIWQNEFSNPKKASYLTLMTLVNKQRVPDEENKDFAR